LPPWARTKTIFGAGKFHAFRAWPEEEQSMTGLLPVGDNQTFRDHLKAVTDIDTALGTGLFAVADPEKGIDEMRVVMVGRISYLDCCKRGANCFHFKWIPDAAKTFDEIGQAKSLGCRGICWEDEDCDSGCICDTRKRRCV
jgi:hypothetical protein